ncbi:MAG: DUF4112 domain-containing protein [Paludibacteraceae bacterium]|nr:DUF4112 domain-containing protein [Paludibacteraceae bacterium]
MISNRKKDILNEAGIEVGDNESIEKTLSKEEKRRAEKEAKRQALLADPLFTTISTIHKVMDTYMIDPILGLFPGIGDLLSSLCALPFLYFALFKVKSISLTLACLFNIIIDALIGFIPIIGDICDIFHRSYKKNMELIVKYVNDDEKGIKETRNKSLMMGVFAIVFVGLLYLLVKILINVFHQFFG